VFSRVLGRRVKVHHLPMIAVKLSMGKEWYQMFTWLNESGFQADIPALRRDYPEVPLTSLAEWLRREGWEGKREITVKRDSMGRPAPAALPASAGGPSRRPPRAKGGFMSHTCAAQAGQLPGQRESGDHEWLRSAPPAHRVGTPVVLLHLAAGPAGVLRPAAAPPEHRAVRGDRPDLPGHGEFRAPCAQHTAAYFTDAVAGFLEAAGSAAPSHWRSPPDSRARSASPQSR
jgi:hypothetical protein